MLPRCHGARHAPRAPRAAAAARRRCCRCGDATPARRQRRQHALRGWTVPPACVERVCVCRARVRVSTCACVCDFPRTQLDTSSNSSRPACGHAASSTAPLVASSGTATQRVRPNAAEAQRVRPNACAAEAPCDGTTLQSLLSTIGRRADGLVRTHALGNLLVLWARGESDLATPPHPATRNTYCTTTLMRSLHNLINATMNNTCMCMKACVPEQGCTTHQLRLVRLVQRRRCAALRPSFQNTCVCSLLLMMIMS